MLQEELNGLNGNYAIKKYRLNECITFRKTNERYGGLSNMAGGYIIYFENHKILTAEALYQACKFPLHPEIQMKIIAQKSPMTAKEISRKYDSIKRDDWNDKRISIMNWCIHLKLLYNWNKFGRLLSETENKDIIELSSKDDFWGAYENGFYAEGYNALGKLLMQLRKDYCTNIDKQFIYLQSPNVDNFKLFGKEVKDIRIDVKKNYNYDCSYNLFDDFNIK